MQSYTDGSGAVFYWKKSAEQLAGALRSSVNRRTGYTPNMMMLGAALVVSSALWDGKGMHSTQLVNWSTIIKMCSFPLSVRGRGPMKSK
jgi:hypothetical protein